ncbi:hypothetical protein [Leptothoe spongobia]|uniref:Uncharacterized protein n=1 Tax=Leptothoe spongobia TAU-MAC 1115 TaxID=1967444 RepID=A0A947DH04_9CYAN|nr:hypothetical protein [Leptothoe spongobia]MBT9316892.1 hypothetical protein [Leptothoe spongobia TAU-MAC 1115]
MEEEHGSDPEALFLGDDPTGKPLLPDEIINPNAGIDSGNLELGEAVLADNTLNGNLFNYDYFDPKLSLGASRGDTSSSFQVLPGLDNVANSSWVATTDFAIAASNSNS